MGKEGPCGSSLYTGLTLGHMIVFTIIYESWESLLESRMWLEQLGCAMMDCALIGIS